MNGAEDLVLVTYEMLRRGYTESEIRKVLGLNFLRAMSQAFLSGLFGRPPSCLAARIFVYPC